MLNKILGKVKMSSTVGKESKRNPTIIKEMGFQSNVIAREKFDSNIFNVKICREILIL